MSERTLTPADIEALAIALKPHQQCNMGLTPEEVTILKRLLGAFQSAAGIVGSIILTAVVVAMIAVFTKGFWASLITGVKQGVIK